MLWLTPLYNSIHSFDFCFSKFLLCNFLPLIHVKFEQSFDHFGGENDDYKSHSRIVWFMISFLSFDIRK